MLRPALRAPIACAQAFRPVAARSLHTSCSLLADAAASGFGAEEALKAAKSAAVKVDPKVLGAKQYSARVQKTADEIVSMSLLEVADLCEVLRSRLNLSEDMLFMPAGGGGGGGAPSGGAAAAAPAAEAPKKEEKTHFDVKLTAIDEKAKIKLIKEVRAASNLGLKEAKELVESAPCVLFKAMKKEDAEAMIAKLKELGAAVELA